MPYDFNQFLFSVVKTDFDITSCIDIDDYKYILYNISKYWWWNYINILTSGFQ